MKKDKKSYTVKVDASRNGVLNWLDHALDSVMVRVEGGLDFYGHAVSQDGYNHLKDLANDIVENNNPVTVKKDSLDMMFLCAACLMPIEVAGENVVYGNCCKVDPQNPMSYALGMINELQEKTAVDDRRVVLKADSDAISSSSMLCVKDSDGTVFAADRKSWNGQCYAAYDMQDEMNVKLIAPVLDMNGNFSNDYEGDCNDFTDGNVVGYVFAAKPREVNVLTEEQYYSSWRHMLNVVGFDMDKQDFDFAWDNCCFTTNDSHGRMVICFEPYDVYDETEHPAAAVVCLTGEVAVGNEEMLEMCGNKQYYGLTDKQAREVAWSVGLEDMRNSIEAEVRNRIDEGKVVLPKGTDTEKFVRDFASLDRNYTEVRNLSSLWSEFQEGKTGGVETFLCNSGNLTEYLDEAVAKLQDREKGKDEGMDR